MFIRRQFQKEFTAKREGGESSLNQSLPYHFIFWTSDFTLDIFLSLLSMTSGSFFLGTSNATHQQQAPAPTQLSSSRMTETTNASPETTVYVVQRTWFDGPRPISTIDFCGGLCATQAMAESIAHASSHALIGQDGIVRTLLLPASASSPSSYAFVTSCGSLFWVRGVQMDMRSSPRIGGCGTTSRNCPLPDVRTATVILTQGIIGGTGNPSSRRGSERRTGCVFADSLVAQTFLQQLPMNLKTISSLRQIPILMTSSMQHPTWEYSFLQQGWRAWPLGGQSFLVEEKSLVEEQEENDRLGSSERSNSSFSKRLLLESQIVNEETATMFLPATKRQRSSPDLVYEEPPSSNNSGMLL